MEQVILNIGLGVSRHFIQTSTEAKRIKDMKEFERFINKTFKNASCFESVNKEEETTFIIQLDSEDYFKYEDAFKELSNYLEQDCISVCLSKEEGLGKFIGRYADKWQEETPFDIQYFKFQ